MSEGSFDSAQALLYHLDIIAPKLDLLHDIISNDQFIELVNGKPGEQLLEYAKSYEQAKSDKKPKMSDSLRKAFDPLLSSLTPTVIIIDYVYSWISQVKTHLNAIVQVSCGLQLRCGYSLSIQTIKLFVNYVKLLTFFRIHSKATFIIKMAPYFKGMRDEFSKMKNKPNDFFLFMNNATKDVYQYISSILMPLREPLTQFISSIGPILIQVMGPWPVVDWEGFAIFNRPNHETESTLPESHLLIIQNLDLMRELVICFVLVYSSFVLKHPLFNSLVTAVLSDCTRLYLTRMCSVNLFDIFEKFVGEEGKKIFLELKDTIENDLSVKMEVGHKQRISHLVYLLRDIHDIGTFNPGILGQVVYQLLPLLSFAYYEINCALTEKTVFGGLTSLIDLLCSLGVLFNKYEHVIKRFFLYNLVTIDNSYLNQLADSLKNANEQWQKNILNMFIKLVQDLSKLDLDSFDRGVNYDVTPFLLTTGRLQYYFSAIQKNQTATFLYPAFEHLEVINLHASFLFSPIHQFLSYSPIHQLWNHSTMLSKYVKDVVGGSNNVSRISCLFAFFNYDKVALNTLPHVKVQLTEKLNEIRTDMLEFTQKEIIENMELDSPLIRITEQNRLDKLFNPAPYIPNNQTSMDETTFREKIWKLKDFLFKMPGIINFNGEDFTISDFIATNITKELAPLIFLNAQADAQWADAVFSASCQYMWGLYTQLGYSFPKMLLDTRYQNSIYPDQTTFLQQISLIRSDCANLIKKNQLLQQQLNSEKNKKGKNKNEEFNNDYIALNPIEYESNMKLISLFEDKLKIFINQDYKYCYYLPHSRAFENFNELTYYAVSFASENSFRKMIDNFGLHSGFNLNRILIAEIAQSMGNIFQIYINLGKSLNSWFTNFRSGGDDWQNAAENNEIAKAAEEMVRCGVMIALRDLLRVAMFDSTNENAPGLISLIRPAYMRTRERLSEKEDLLMEMISAEPTFFFIKTALDSMGIEKTSDSIQFFFFLALLMIYPKWENSQFVQEHELITNNLHLIPMAIDAFINVLSTFCQSHDEKIVASGMQFYFTVLQHIVQLKRQKEELKLKCACAYIILADLFPKYVKSIEYGRISLSFPNSVVSEAYRQVESSDSKFTISVRIKESPTTKNKKNEKGKKKSKR